MQPPMHEEWLLMKYKGEMPKNMEPRTQSSAHIYLKGEYDFKTTGFSSVITCRAATLLQWQI